MQQDTGGPDSNFCQPNQARQAPTQPHESHSDVCPPRNFSNINHKIPFNITTIPPSSSTTTMSSDAPKRIAISFSSSSNKNAPKPPPSSLGKRPRAGGFGDDDSDSDDAQQGRQEKITGFGADGAETKNKKKEEVKREYVIAKQLNKDWRGEKRRQKSGLPGREGANGQTVEREPADQDSGIKWGLTVKEKVKKEEEEADVKAEPTSDNEDAPAIKMEEDERVITKEDYGAPDDPDKEAMSALLGTGPSKPEAVIPSESDAYQRDITTTGEASTLEDYESMPVEEFGAALLRGMGWDGKERGTMRYKEVKRRPARLGLGAKELKGQEELGGWGQGGKGGKKRPRLDEYNREKERERERRDARRGDGGREREDRYERKDRDRDYDRRRDERRHDDRRRDRHRDDRDRRR